jgi:hypothetical protein
MVMRQLLFLQQFVAATWIERRIFPWVDDVSFGSRLPGRQLFQRDFIGFAEQFKRSGNVSVSLYVEGDPAASRQNVMRLGPTGGNQFISDAPGEGDVHPGVAVDVADFARMEAVFRTAKPMRVRGNFRPA